MSSDLINELIRQAETLTPDEQLHLASHLVQRAKQRAKSSAPRRNWREVRGLAKEPLVGEDAQAWISRTRREDTEQTEQILRRDD